MWMFYSTFAIVHIVFFPSIIPWSVVADSMTPYSDASSLQQSTNENVLWNSEPPTIVKELPSSASIYSTGDLWLHCNIRGSPRPTYQWYMSTTDLTESTLSIQDQAYEPVESVNDDRLFINGKMTKKAYSKYVYYCSAQNSLGTIQSNKILVHKVIKPKTVSIKYDLFSVCRGEKFAVQCYLVPDIMPLYKFQYWEVNLTSGARLKINETGGRYSVILSTKYPQLHIRNVTEDDFQGTKYRCLFRSTINDEDDVSGNVPQSVQGYSYNFVLSKTLGFTGETLNVLVGTNVELPFSSAPLTLNVTWYKIDPSDSKKTYKIGSKAGETKFTMVSQRYGNLLITNISKDDAGKYLVQSTTKDIHTTFTINVYETLIIDLAPRNVQRQLSESAEFVCRASVSKCQYRWLHNGQRIVNGYDSGNVEIATFFNGSVLRIKEARLSVSGVYQCIAIYTDDIKSMSDFRQISGTLLLSAVPPILVKQSPSASKGSPNGKIWMSMNDEVKTIECVFAANPRPSLDWYQDSNRVNLTEEIKVYIERDQSSIYHFIAKLTINPKMIGSDKKASAYAGEYKAVATNPLGFTTCNTFIFMDGDFDIRLPKEQTAVGGKDYLLTCFFVAKGVPEFFWDRKITNSETWETLPVNHRTNLIANGHRLLIKNVIKTEDEGIYRCKIKLEKDSLNRITKLLVAYPPILQNLPSKHDSSQSQTHICTIKSTADKPWYAWWTFTKYSTNETVIIAPNTKYPMFRVYYNQLIQERKPLLPGVPDFLQDYSNVGVDLNVNARSDDKDSFGTFVCHAKNHIGYDKKTIDDNFLRLEFKITPPSSSEVVIGGDLSLDCTAKESDLKPIVKWRLLKKDSNYVDIESFKNDPNQRIYQYQNGTLILKNIKQSDPSKFFCFIFPTGKSENVQSKISYIEIKVPAWIKTLDSEIFKVSGTTFNLSCDVYGHDQELKVDWFFRASSIGLWMRMYEPCISSSESPCVNSYNIHSREFLPILKVHNRTHRTVHLEFRDVTDASSGHYKCEAKNRFSRSSGQMTTTLTIISRPSSVMEPIQKDSTPTSVTLEWKPPEKDGNRPIIRYVIRYFEVSYMVEQRNVTQKTIRVNSTVQSIVIDQLRPYRKYEGTVAAENEVGVSEPTTVDLMTEQAPPQRHVNNLIASSTTPYEILISWNDPDPEFQNGKILRYQMCYQIIPPAEDNSVALLLDRLHWPIGNSNELNQDPNVKCQDTRTKTITVSSLPQFTDFAIRVIAFNIKGPSPAQFTKVRTLEDLPQAAPSHVTCESQQRHIVLTWNPPGRQTINGILRGYVVNYYKPNKYNDESDMQSIDVQGQTRVILPNLTPYTIYSIQIMAENRKGLGPASKSVFCTTKEAKPEPPEMVKAMKINSTCFYVSWLHTLNPNGKIQAYCVTVIVAYVPEITKCQPPEMKSRYNTMIYCSKFRDNREQFSSVKVYVKNQQGSDPVDAQIVDERTNIISFGGSISVEEGLSVVLPCETVPSKDSRIYWKRNGQEFINNDFPSLKILKNNSLEISSILKTDFNWYVCSTESDNIEYRLVVQESMNGIPRAPIIDDSRVTENSIFIRWKSKGTSDVAAPILKFTIHWENLYTGDSKTVQLNENVRSFYLNNVTCASDFLVKVRSHSVNGPSSYSETRRLRTLGSAPLFADGNVLIPRANISANSASFNFLAFVAGDNCSAMYYSILISVTMISGHELIDPIFTKNISVYDLENRCCYNVTGLKPMTTYKYMVTAYNPAGSVPTYGMIETLAAVRKGSVNVGENARTFGNQFWLLLCIMLLILISIVIVIVVKGLQIIRKKERRTHNGVSKMAVRKSDYNQSRIDKSGNQDDAASTGSDPSPYAVYQPNTDAKNGQIRPQLLSKQNSTPIYSINDHHYNKIRYEFVERPIPLENRYERHRRANSAECLSSLGNASVAGVSDLESPDNIDPNDNLKAPRIPCTDEVFENIQYPDFSTINRKKKRRESDRAGRSTEEEESRLMKNNNNPGVMNTSRHSTGSRSRQNEPPAKQPQHQKQQQQQHMYPMPGNANRHIYRQQMSVPEPSSNYNQQQYGYRSNRLRTASGSGHNHPISTTALPHNSGSSGQVSGYGSYYGSRAGNMQPYSTTANIRRDNDFQNGNLYGPSNGQSNYNPGLRSMKSKSILQPIESPDEGIYTDRVIVV